MLLGAGDGFDGPDRSQMLCEGQTLMAQMSSCLLEVHFRAGPRNKFIPKTRGRSSWASLPLWRPHAVTLLRDPRARGGLLGKSEIIF